MVITEGYLAVIRTMRVGPVITLVWKREMSVGNSLGALRQLQPITSPSIG